MGGQNLRRRLRQHRRHPATSPSRPGATVVEHAWEGYARQKNWALDNLPFESDWVLIVDADEAVTPELRQSIEAIVSRPTAEVEEAGFYLNRVFVFAGRKIWHCGYFPSWNLRLFKRGRARYEERRVHEHMIVDGPVAYLGRHDLLHHEDRRGMEHFFAKHNRYSTLEAQQIVAEPEPWNGWREFSSNRITRLRFVKTRVLPAVPMAWVIRFLYMYVLRLGVLDGRAGLALCAAISSYEFMVQAKVRELRRLAGDAPAQTDPAPQRSRAGLATPEGDAPALAAATPLPDAADGPPAAPPAPAGVSAARPVTRAHARQTRLVPQLGHDEVDVRSPWTLRQNVGRVLWMLARATLFRWSFHNWYGFRRALLRAFGAKIGRGVRVRPTAMIEIPWNLSIGDHAIIGDYAILYSLGEITIGRRVVISQFAHLCAGTHDFNDPNFPLVRPPIAVGDEAWVAADAFVGPGVTVGRRAVLGARSSTFKDIPAGKIAGGNPSKVLRDRDPAPEPEPESSADADADNNVDNNAPAEVAA